MSKENKITAYKGFNRDMACNRFHYEVGKEYEMPEDEVQICQAGFHACESPLEVLDYYFMDDNCDMARFAEVEQSGKISMENDGSTKKASSKIRIKAELKFSDLVKIGIDWLIEKTKPVVGKKAHNNDGGEDSAKIGSSGYSARIGSSGDYAKINSTGEDSVICCAGHGSRVKAKLGPWITLAEWGWDDAKRRDVPKMVKTVQIDGETYKADTWYKLVNGEIVEVK